MRGVSVAVLALLVLVGACLPGRPHRLLYRLLRLDPPRDFYSFLLPARPDAASYFDRLLFGLSLPALLGVACSVQQAWWLHRGLGIEGQRWAGALLLAFAANEGSPTLLRPILVLGLGHFSRVLEVEARVHCRRLLTRFGERVLDLHEEPAAGATAQAEGTRAPR